MRNPFLGANPRWTVSLRKCWLGADAYKSVVSMVQPQGVNDRVLIAPKEHIGCGPIRELDAQPPAEETFRSFQLDPLNLISCELILTSHGRPQQNPPWGDTKLLDTKGIDGTGLDHVAAAADELMRLSADPGSGMPTVSPGFT